MCEREQSFLRTLQARGDARRHHFMESSERDGFAKLFDSLLGLTFS